MIIKDVNLLRQISTNVESVEEATEIIEKLKTELEKNPNGMGLSAIQIGIPKRVSVIKFNDSYHYLINSKEIEKQDEFSFPSEGCLSLEGVRISTKRYFSYIIDNFVLDANVGLRKETQYYYFSPDYKERHDSLLAIAVQHEYDHFEGILIQDIEMKSKPILSNKKVKRNDPCPCGSGKKFKKCCEKVS